MFYYLTSMHLNAIVHDQSQISSEVRRRMADVDYSQVEQKCPNKLPIGQLMREAVFELV